MSRANRRIKQLEARIADLDALVQRLLTENAELKAENAQLQREDVELRAENAKLRGENAALKEKVGKSSRNSSRPPSSDGPKDRAERRTKKPTGRKPGGQPGRSKAERAPWPAEKVNKRVVLRPTACEACALPLVGPVDSEPRRHQVFELPKVEPVVTEFVQHSRECGCGHVTCAPLPAGVPHRIFGPSVDATVGYFIGVHKMGKRGVAEALVNIYGLPMSLGAVVDSQREASEALAAPYVEIVAHAQAARVKNADETSWIEGNGKKARAWLWTLVTATAIVFMIQKSRATGAAIKLLLNGKTLMKDLTFGVLVTDRHGAYNFWPLALHQFCWAHLARDFTAISERAGAAGVLGGKLVEETARMFGWWGRVRDGTLSRDSFRVYMRPLRARVEALLTEGTHLDNKTTARTCKKLLKASQAMWTFVRIDGVEPTNNSGERAVRPGVIYRKLSAGTKSVAGSRFVERILTVHATLRLQGRPILPFLQAACEARLRRTTPPSLLPIAPPESLGSRPPLRIAA